VPERVTIDAIGHRGDGVARTADGPLYVPFALPGEEVLVERQGQRGRLVDVLTPSPHRTEPPCRHFGRCGGCALQMLPVAGTRRLKHDFVVAALAKEGIATEVAETAGVNPSSRRRAVLTAIRPGKVCSSATTSVSPTKSWTSRSARSSPRRWPTGSWRPAPCWRASFRGRSRSG